MYILNLAQRLIYNKPLLHIIVTIQLVVSFFVIETAISTLTLTTGSSKFMENLLDSNFCYYSIAERNISIDDNGNIVVNNSDVFLEDCLVGVEAIMHTYTAAANRRPVIVLGFPVNRLIFKARKNSVINFFSYNIPYILR